ncbi:NAD(P)-dependent dehydrogenase (short-subunit alcohol dehydrogenase family) [Luteococcus japonicus]|uniref:NAD(P)-dependent dehydrogenase (Short-subunit alcohol dehydrogenase family) n=1 Tax=Luteococcus japonicus TaxID=33984 RepID=A0A3N1ZTC7_9ACTN|nr:SDR family NAD(P)-dependent oxidoreductase [Luteococcus japonicus]ROR53958.1 NAD(P)-dependent dehydrogenase (short-subunit alcohol dehydrogenase family) [Luteococcus japonicus]
MDLQTITGAGAIVTGGASGLGAATAAHLADRGLVVTAFDLAAGLEKARAAGATREDINYVAVDVTDDAAVADAVAGAAQGAPLRVAVNCAGICPSARIVGRKGTHDAQLFATTIQVNLVGTFHVLTHAVAAMAANEPLDDDGQRGVVVNTASVAAFEGQVGQVAYAASKGGVHSLTIAAARDLSSLGIRVNSIAPGVVWTPMMESINEDFRTELEARVPFPGRFARPEEYARLVGAIVENDYINGETIRLDGALRMPPR